eukprot:TRINITY_DN5365_c0_g1_i1.p1 TRINITY_DN5365_c0_g1~~TRINITY_DN5365_c0_g1_i1.p1  ORF type:complete len:146 (+),score=16.32 TRINITY_DN5365_c0_g1_i1:22-459(+)
MDIIAYDEHLDDDLTFKSQITHIQHCQGAQLSRTGNYLDLLPTPQGYSLYYHENTLQIYNEQSLLLCEHSFPEGLIVDAKWNCINTYIAVSLQRDNYMDISFLQYGGSDLILLELGYTNNNPWCDMIWSNVHNIFSVRPIRVFGN